MKNLLLAITITLAMSVGCVKVNAPYVGSTFIPFHSIDKKGYSAMKVGKHVIQYDYRVEDHVMRVVGSTRCVEGYNFETDFTKMTLHFLMLDSTNTVIDNISRQMGMGSFCGERQFDKTIPLKGEHKGMIIYISSMSYY